MKTNEATYNRPDGTRFIDASYVIANLEERIDQLKSEHAWEKSDRNSITLFKSSGVTIVLTCLHEEASISDITVDDGVIMLQVIDGKINLTTEGDAFELCEKKMVVLHSGVEHSIYSLKDSTILLTHFECED